MYNSYINFIMLVINLGQQGNVLNITDNEYIYNIFINLQITSYKKSMIKFTMQIVKHSKAKFILYTAYFILYCGRY